MATLGAYGDDWSDLDLSLRPSTTSTSAAQFVSRVGAVQASCEAFQLAGRGQRRSASYGYEACLPTRSTPSRFGHRVAHVDIVYTQPARHRAVHECLVARIRTNLPRERPGNIGPHNQSVQILLASLSHQDRLRGHAIVSRALHTAGCSRHKHLLIC